MMFGVPSSGLSVCKVTSDHDADATSVGNYPIHTLTRGAALLVAQLQVTEPFLHPADQDICRGRSGGNVADFFGAHLGAGRHLVDDRLQVGQLADERLAITAGPGLENLGALLRQLAGEQQRDLPPGSALRTASVRPDSRAIRGM
jgi:hypothetical protein